MNWRFARSSFSRARSSSFRNDNARAGGFFNFRRRGVLSARPSGILRGAVVAGGMYALWTHTDVLLAGPPATERPPLPEAGHVIEGLPEYSRDEIARHFSPEDRIWVTFRHGVYDISDFIADHPGGDAIENGFGGAIDPYWAMFGVHRSAHVFALLEKHRIGNVIQGDRFSDEELKAMEDTWAAEPSRLDSMVNRAFTVQPFNCEAALPALSTHVTPTEEFFSRSHLPVPRVDLAAWRLIISGPNVCPKVIRAARAGDEAVASDLIEAADLRSLPNPCANVIVEEVAKVSKLCGASDEDPSSPGTPDVETIRTVTMSMADLLRLPQASLTSTIMCSGNRRTSAARADQSSHYPPVSVPGVPVQDAPAGGSAPAPADAPATSPDVLGAGLGGVPKDVAGLPWGPGAISTGYFEGPRVRDVLALVGVTVDPFVGKGDAEDPVGGGGGHIIMEGLDTGATGAFGASVPASIVFERGPPANVKRLVRNFVATPPCPIPSGADADKSPVDKEDKATPKASYEPIDVPGHPAPVMACDLYGEPILALRMNGQPLPRDRGYPCRFVAPGVVGVRNVKWLHRLTLAEHESEAFWQKNDYRAHGPAGYGAGLAPTKAASIIDFPIQSAITSPAPGGIVDVVDTGITEGPAGPAARAAKVRGYAFVGGGRGVQRVEVSADGGRSWSVANLEATTGPWAWRLWNCAVPIPQGVEASAVAVARMPKGMGEAGARTVPMTLMVRAVDGAYNIQPTDKSSIWNQRGLLQNAWQELTVQVPV